MDFLIVIPAFNEEKNISGVLNDLLTERLPADILVVDDGSIDQTSTNATQAGVHVVSHPCNLGYGAALQTGFKYAAKHGYPYILQFDSDGQHNPGDLWTIVQELQKGQADVVIGSRYLGDVTYHPGLLKSLAVRLFRGLIYSATKRRITDPTSGLRGMSENVFKYYSVRDRFPSDFPDADIVIQMLLYKFRITEVPIGNRSRVQGKSMHSGIKPVIYLFKVLLSILSVLLNYKVRKWSHL